VLASLAARVRRGSPIVRRQVGWLTYGVAAYAFFLVFALFVFPNPNALAGVVLDANFFLPLPVAIWIEVSRHRLDDLDRLVNRTVVHGVVVALLAGSTLVVAGLFTPFSGGCTRGSTGGSSGPGIGPAKRWGPSPVVFSCRRTRGRSSTS
jgi:two-component system, NarL family, sensor kinase